MAAKIPKKPKKARDYSTPWTPQAKLWRGYKPKLHWQETVCTSFPSWCGLVAWGLSSRVNHNDGYAFPQREAISSITGIAHACNVSLALRKLERKNLITVFRVCPRLVHFIARRGTKPYLHPKQSVYVVHLPADAEEIRTWHKVQGITRKIRPSVRKGKRLGVSRRVLKIVETPEAAEG